MVVVDPDYYDALVAKKYKFQRKMGRGLYSVVWQAYDSDEKPVAIKRIFSSFQNRVDAQRVYREVTILNELKHHPNIITLIEVLSARDDRDLYIVMDFMQSDLSTALKSNSLKPIHKEYITWQILNGLSYIHGAGIVHRDLNPSSILLNNRCDARICDFGSARSVTVPRVDLMTPIPESVNPNVLTDKPVMTQYMSNRWYRSPEQLLSSCSYSTAIDIWALGCIVGEMILVRPIFLGTSTLSQLEMIMSFCGRAKSDEITALYVGQTADILQGLGKRKPEDLETFFPMGSVESNDIIRLMLRVAPDQRITANEALEHPYVSRFHNPDEENLFKSEQVSLSLDDNIGYTVNNYRDYIYAEILGRESSMQKIKEDREARNIASDDRSV